MKLVDAEFPNDLEWSERAEGRKTLYTAAPPRLSALPILVFAGIWDSFLVFFYVAIHRSPQAPGVVLVFPIVHALVGAYVTWLALAKTLNRTIFAIDRESFVVTHAPIPARGARFVTRDVERFEAREVKSSRGSSTWKIRVVARGEGGVARDLSLPIDEREHVVFLVAKLNAALASSR